MKSCLLLLTILLGCASTSEPLATDSQYKVMFDQAITDYKILSDEEFNIKYDSLINGDPQKNRWIYIYQYYIIPTLEMPIPKNYTGVWNDWYLDGQIRLKFFVRSGERSGRFFHWLPDGSKFSIGNFNDSMLNEERQVWYDSGEFYGGRGLINNTSNYYGVTYYKNGKIKSHSIAYKSLTKNLTKNYAIKYSNDGKLTEIVFWESDFDKAETIKTTIIFSLEEGVDKRKLFQDEIDKTILMLSKCKIEEINFEIELAKFEIKYQKTVSQ